MRRLPKRNTGEDVVKLYTVKEVARLSGVTVRTLHHYDELGLLKPAAVGENGYRYYGRDELLRLQQILFHRELELPLEAIGGMLAGADRAAALKAHRQVLAGKARRYRRLLKTLDRTLAALEGAEEMKDEDLYKGFAPEKQPQYEAWLKDRYGPGVAERIEASGRMMKGWSREDFQRLMDGWEEIEGGVAKALAEGLPASSPPVQALIRRQYEWVARTWPNPPTRAAFAGLGQIYQDHPDFRARFDGRMAGLTDYFAEAMRLFAESELT